MNTVPERAKNDSPDLPQFSRLEGYRLDWAPDWAGTVSQDVENALRAEYMPEMPEIVAGRYLIDYLFDVGPVVSGSMGSGPVTSKNLIPWMEEQGLSLQPWEARFIRRLSQEYLAESQKATDRKCPPPWRPS